MSMLRRIRTALHGVAIALWAVAGSSGRGLLAAEPGQPLKVDWSQATLSYGPRSVRSLRIEGAIEPEHPVEGGTLRVKGSVVERLDTTRKVVWRHDAGRFVDLRFLTGHGDAVVLAESSLGLFVQPKPGIALRRLRLADGQKLETLVIPATPDESKRRGEILGAVTIGEGLFVLSQSLDLSTETGWRTRRYRIDRFHDAWTWSRSFEPETALPADLIDPTTRTRNLDNLQTLSRMGDSLVVCAGPRENVIVLEAATGKTRWQAPRPWEYEKGFIGPSVWSHFIDRHGSPRFDSQARKTFQTAHGELGVPGWERESPMPDGVGVRMPRPTRRLNSIVAGPVPLQVTQGKWPQFSLFVVTSQTMEETLPSSLSACVVYEFDQGGGCIGMVTLPRFVDPLRFQILEDSVVWRCEQSDRVRLYPSSRESHPLGGGIGNPKKTIDIDWHPARRGRAPASKEALAAWLRQGVFAEAAAFHGETLLSVTEGGFIEREGSGAFRYPLMLTDFNSGETRRLMLNLPFEGEVIPPEGKSVRSGDQWVADTPFLMTIESLAARGHELLVEFHYGYFRWTLAFDLDELLRVD